MARGAVEVQHAGGCAVGKRLLRDQLRGKMKIEFRDQHRLSIVRARAACRPRSLDRKSTRLNSSHLVISYAVFCLKKKRQLKWTSCRDYPRRSQVARSSSNPQNRAISPTAEFVATSAYLAIASAYIASAPAARSLT